MEIECWADEHCLLIGEVKKVDNSFDHEFGREKIEDLEVSDFSVIVYVGMMEHDITKALSDEWIRYYKEKLKDFAQPIFEDAG